MAFQQEYFAIPPITRAYTTTCLLTTIAVVSEISFQMKFSYHYSGRFHRAICSSICLSFNFETQLFRYNRIERKEREEEEVIDRCRHSSGVGAR